MPFGKDSYKSAETLGYLNSQQALADFAILIRSLKQNLPYEEIGRASCRERVSPYV